MAEAVLLQADARAIPLADKSVNLVVTSSPYWSLVDYEDERQIGLEEHYGLFLNELWAVMDQLARVLVDGGSVFWNIGDKSAGSGGHNNPGGKSRPKAYIKTAKRGPGHGDREGQTHNYKAKLAANLDCGDVPNKSRMGLPWRFALGCIERGWLLRAPIVWKKNCIPQNAKDRVEIKHEDIFHFTRTSPAYADTQLIRQWPSPWEIPTEPLFVPEELGEHPAPFPSEIPRRAILGWCPPGGVVLDPFCGSGTTVMVAQALGRTGIGLDLNAGYLDIARWRVQDSGHGSRSRERTNREAQLGLLEAS
jgi:DNA modification methylase